MAIITTAMAGPCLSIFFGPKRIIAETRRELKEKAASKGRPLSSRTARLVVLVHDTARGTRLLEAAVSTLMPHMKAHLDVAQFTTPGELHSQTEMGGGLLRSPEEAAARATLKTQLADVHRRNLTSSVTVATVEDPVSEALMHIRSRSPQLVVTDWPSDEWERRRLQRLVVASPCTVVLWGGGGAGGGGRGSFAASPGRSPRAAALHAVHVDAVGAAAASVTLGKGVEQTAGADAAAAVANGVADEEAGAAAAAAAEDEDDNAPPAISSPASKHPALVRALARLRAPSSTSSSKLKGGAAPPPPPPPPRRAFHLRLLLRDEAAQDEAAERAMGAFFAACDSALARVKAALPAAFDLGRHSGGGGDGGGAPSDEEEEEEDVHAEAEKPRAVTASSMAMAAASSLSPKFSKLMVTGWPDGARRSASSEYARARSIDLLPRFSTHPLIHPSTHATSVSSPPPDERECGELVRFLHSVEHEVMARRASADRASLRRTASSLDGPASAPASSFRHHGHAVHSKSSHAGGGAPGGGGGGGSGGDGLKRAASLDSAFSSEQKSSWLGTLSMHLALPEVDSETSLEPIAESSSSHPHTPVTPASPASVAQRAADVAAVKAAAAAAAAESAKK